MVLTEPILKYQMHVILYYAHSECGAKASNQKSEGYIFSSHSNL